MKKLICGLIVISLIGLISGQDQSHLPPCTAELQNRHFPSRFDCESYFTCFNLNFVLQRCPTGFWFLETRETCVVPSAHPGCEFAPVTTAAPTTQTTSTTTTPTTAPSTTVSTQTPVIECPDEGVGRIPNPFSCTRHFLCFNGHLVEQTCSPGLYFSRSQSRCVRREDSDCVLNNESCPAENDPDNVVFLPDQEDCQRYFVCLNGAPVDSDCGERLHWDPIYNWCIKEENSECEPSYPLPEVRDIECPQDTGSDVIFLPHPEECQFYFICLDGVSLLARCARNMLFDHILEQCFFAESARCFNINPQLDFLRNLKV